jgi:hypothetical protein
VALQIGANRAAKKVAGRKAIVMIAIAFIDELSRFAAADRLILARASTWVSK